MDKVLVTGGRGLVGSAIKSLTSEYPDLQFLFSSRLDHDLTSDRGRKRCCLMLYSPIMLFTRLLE